VSSSTINKIFARDIAPKEVPPSIEAKDFRS
jgi:hypothetical protein